MFDGGHAESFSQIVRDEGWFSTGFGQLTFVEGEHDEVSEIEVTCFQHSHYLHTDGWFTVERNIWGCKQAAKKTFQSVSLQIKFATVNKTEQTVDEGIALE